MREDGEGQAIGRVAVRCGQFVGCGVSEKDRRGSFGEGYILPKKGACEVERRDAKYALKIVGELKFGSLLLSFFIYFYDTCLFAPITFPAKHFIL